MTLTEEEIEELRQKFLKSKENQKEEHVFFVGRIPLIIPMRNYAKYLHSVLWQNPELVEKIVSTLAMKYLEKKPRPRMYT